MSQHLPMIKQPSPMKRFNYSMERAIYSDYLQDVDRFKNGSKGTSKRKFVKKMPNNISDNNIKCYTYMKNNGKVNIIKDAGATGKNSISFANNNYNNNNNSNNNNNKNNNSNNTNRNREHMQKHMMVWGTNEHPYPKRYIYKQLIVLDYDDTILPTSWITQQNKLTLLDDVPPSMQRLFAKLSDVVIYTLKLCSKQGNIIIVTNASLEWLVNSAKKYIPSVWEFIVNNRIMIISARDQLINTAVDPQNWKTIIFHQLVNEMLSPYINNERFLCCVYSVGDGNDERNACFSISQMDKYSTCIFKSLKFLSEPTCEKLIAEHEILRFFFNNDNNK